MTIEEFRARMRAGPSAEELKTGFEKRIAEIANNTISEREDYKKLKKRVAELEATVEKMQSTLNELTGTVPEEPK